MCRRAGHGRVQVIERDVLASGPSGSAAGGLSPGMYTLARPGPFADLAWDSLRLHRELDDEWDGAIGLRTVDWLIVSAERIPSEGIDVPGVDVLDAGATQAAEPLLAPAGGAISIPGQSWVHPTRLALALAARAGSIATGVSMTGIRSSGGRVVTVETTEGDISPGAVVLATGGAPSGVAIPGGPVKGHLLVTSPMADPPRCGIASSVIVLPLPDGRLVAGGTFDVGDDEPVVRDDVVAGIRAEMSRVLPATENLATERAWVCFRPGTPDEMPVIDRVPGFENAWMSVGHYRTGLLLAPGAGRMVAGWIGGEEPTGSFALSRFT
jgi:glycine/D-amino acid oxidase-like deaminating enzyme